MLKSIELNGFKSFGRKTSLVFTEKIAGVVGPNGSGKSNVAEGFRFVLGEQSMKAMRTKRGEDLIWGGSPALPRMNRASVKVVFDNSKRLLDIDFSEVTIERVVYRDGQNEYLLNGTQVRLKDVIRLLAGANIGGSGYQIISQGEADRILTASPKERREMIEDALGLKLYQHKKVESERKLEETAVNLEKTRSLRREIAPHLKFLRDQVEKIEKAREMKDELAHTLRDYLLREDARIKADTTLSKGDMQEVVDALRETENQLKLLQAAKTETISPREQELSVQMTEQSTALQKIRELRSSLSRDLGRAEGALMANTITVEQVVSAPHVRQFAHEIDETLATLESGSDAATVQRVILALRARIQSFIDGLTGVAPVTNHEAELAVKELAKKLEDATAEEARVIALGNALRSELSQEREKRFERERDSVTVESKVRELQSRLSSFRRVEDELTARRERFENEVREGIALVGTALSGWNTGEIPQDALSEEQFAQDKRRRAIERLKIKIEEAGIGGSEEVIREYTHTKERDEFLAKEIVDLEASAEKLKDLIAELEKTMDQKFTEGLHKINDALGHFFSKLFNGGMAKLEVETPVRKKRTDDEEIEEVPEEEELYAGLSVSVQLPRKKVTGLEILSGGERALTSIALIFSMSQVNPPPFLILDETDAALDEANSKRYADMIRELGQKSQLIFITHNRATMAAGGELYGVTMGHDGVSQILSVKLEEAVKVAK